MEDAALFVKNVISTNWSAGNTAGITPDIRVGYDTNVKNELTGGGFANSADIIYVQEVPNSGTQQPAQLGDNGWRTRVRVNVNIFTASSSTSITPQQHCLVLAKECVRIIRSNVKQGTTYDYIEPVGYSNDSNTRNNFSKYVINVELIQQLVTI